jgi:hypothetical protein
MEPGGLDGLAATRRVEFTQVRRAIDRAAAGECSIVLVEGEADIGKTHLITTTADLARDEGALVLRTGLTEVEAMLPWAGLSVLLAGVDERILDRVPPPRRRALDRARGEIADGEVEAHDVAAALASLLAVCSADRLTVLVIDDVQWLDPATAAAFAFSVRANVGARLAILVARRTDVGAPVDFTRIPDATVDRVAMSGLSPAGLHHLLIDHDAALALFEAASEAHDRLPVVLPLERGRTLLAAGSAMRRAGRRSAARPLLVEARDVFDGRRRDAVRRPRRRRDRPTRWRRGLRRPQRDRAAGGSAELFISVRTVESNLTRVYRKLGVRSRTELARSLESAG